MIMSLRRSLALVLVGVVTVSAAFAGPLKPEVRESLEKLIEQRVTRWAFVPGSDFSNWPQIVAKHRKELDQVGTEEGFAAIINTALAEYKCSHFAVMTPEQNKARAQGSRAGIGIYTEVTQDGIAVKGVVPGSPADKAGIKDGEVIVLVDNVKPSGAEALQGPVGQEFTLRVRGTDGATREVKVIRAIFSTKEPETLKWLNPEVGVVRIPSFETYNTKAVNDLMKEAGKAKLLAIDLRGNPGGYVFNMTHFAGLLLPQGSAMGTMVNRFMSDQFAKETGKPATDLVGFAEWTKAKLVPGKPAVPRFSGQIVVLVDGGTGSAAEMLAAGLRDAGGAKVYGQKSIGMVLAALMQPLDEGFSMMIPVQDYVTIKGQRLEGSGVKPDVEINSGAKRGKEDDPAWAAVLQLAATIPDSGKKF